MSQGFVRRCVRAVAIVAVAAFGLGSAAPAAADPVPESQVFEFGSFDDRGEFIHCAASLSPDPSGSGLLVPGDETCFQDADDAMEFALGGGPGAAAQAQAAAAGVVPDGLIAIHYELPGFRGASLALAGVDCAGGGVTLTGGVWDNRISSTANGCSQIEHYDISSDFVFEGDLETTTGPGGNLSTLDNRTSGILYKGALNDPVTLVGLEITQGVQDWEGSVELVAEKRTVVRAFMEPTGGATATEVVGRLYFDRNDGTTFGPLLPINSGGSFVARPNAAGSRDDLDRSLNFWLPTWWSRDDGTIPPRGVGRGCGVR